MLDTRFEYEVQLMGKVRAAKAAQLSSVKQAVRYNIDPRAAAGMVMHQTDDALLDMYGYVHAERHFNKTMRGWVGYWRYLCELKEYTVTTDMVTGRDDPIKRVTLFGNVNHQG